MLKVLMLRCQQNSAVPRISEAKAIIEVNITERERVKGAVRGGWGALHRSFNNVGNS
jgi:hypothetical protein